MARTRRSLKGCVPEDSGGHDRAWVAGWCLRGSEAVMLAMACLAPWAFGAVEAWAEFGLEVGIVLLATLGAVGAWFSKKDAVVFNVPGLALGLLATLAICQAVPLPARLLRGVAPATAALHSALIPLQGETVIGDEKPPVPLPPATLSQQPEASIRSAAMLAAAWILFHSVLRLGPGYQALRRFAIAITANATLLAVFSIIQFLTWNGKIYWFRPSPSGSAGPFVCHGHLAAYLNLGFGFALGWLFSPHGAKSRRRQVRVRPFASYASAVIMVGILVSLSRIGFLGSMVILLLAVALLRPNIAQLGVALVAFSALLLLFLQETTGAIPYLARLETLLGGHPYEARWKIWTDAIGAWWQFPVWGTGIGTFANAAAPFFRNIAGEQFIHAENEYLEWLVEGGVIGASLALAGVIGIVVLATRGLGAADSSQHRALVVGAILGGATILTDSAGDFALHIPGVAVTMVILCGYLCKLGLEARESEPQESGVERGHGFLAVANLLALPCLALAILFLGFDRARAEAAYVAAGSARFADLTGTTPSKPRSREDLERVRQALVSALSFRPEWAEGHQQLGLTLLKLYQLSTEEELRNTIADPAERAWVADPLWLHVRIHARPSDAPPLEEALLGSRSVRAYLIPAARSFLEARRCCPVLPIPYAGLASLDYLLKGNASSAVMVARSFRLAGPNVPVIRLCARLAMVARDAGLLAAILKRQLLAATTGWEPVADDAGACFTPEQIATQVVPSGRLAVLFADRLYPDAKDRTERDHLLRAAIDRLPTDTVLSPPERAYWAAKAWERIGDRERAVSRLLDALMLDPRQASWRAELVGWYIQAGKFAEAHSQALIGLSTTPADPATRRSWELAVDALARGGHNAPPS